MRRAAAYALTARDDPGGSRLAAAYALTVVVLVLGWLMLGCGATSREKTISSTLIAANASRDAFVAYDGQHQQLLIDESKTKPEAVAKLAEYRVEQAKVESLFGGVYRAVALAAVLDADQSLSGLLSAAGLLRDELKALGVLP
jgi:hypothetical protein